MTDKDISDKLFVSLALCEHIAEEFTQARKKPF